MNPDKKGIEEVQRVRERMKVIRLIQWLLILGVGALVIAAISLMIPNFPDRLVGVGLIVALALLWIKVGLITIRRVFQPTTE